MNTRKMSEDKHSTHYTPVPIMGRIFIEDTWVKNTTFEYYAYFTLGFLKKTCSQRS